MLRWDLPIGIGIPLLCLGDMIYLPLKLMQRASVRVAIIRHPIKNSKQLSFSVDLNFWEFSIIYYFDYFQKTYFTAV